MASSAVGLVDEFLSHDELIELDNAATLPGRAMLSVGELVPRTRPALLVSAKTAESTDRPRLESTIHVLLSKVKLVPNWDSYGGRPTSMDSLIGTLNVLDGVMSENTKAPWVVPTSEGHIQLEWHTETTDLEIEVSGRLSGTIYWCDKQNGEEWEGVLPEGLPRLKSLVEHFVE